MIFGRYEHENIKDKVEGYMVPSPSLPNETREQQFARAKSELLTHLRRQIERVEAFGYEDMAKKVS